MIAELFCEWKGDVSESEDSKTLNG